MFAALLAHQGGWDEALLVLLPIAFIFGVLYLAKRRAERAASAREVPSNESSAAEPEVDRG